MDTAIFWALVVGEWIWAALASPRVASILCILLLFAINGLHSHLNANAVHAAELQFELREQMRTIARDTVRMTEDSRLDDGDDDLRRAADDAMRDGQPG